MPEKWNVLTYRDYDCTMEGRNYKGRILHCYRESYENGWPGVEYAKMKIPANSSAYTVHVKPLSQYELSFDRWGKVVNMVECEPAA